MSAASHNKDESFYRHISDSSVKTPAVVFICQKPSIQINPFPVVLRIESAAVVVVVEQYCQEREKEREREDRGLPRVRLIQSAAWLNSLTQHIAQSQTLHLFSPLSIKSAEKKIQLGCLIPSPSADALDALSALFLQQTYTDVFNSCTCRSVFVN